MVAEIYNIVIEQGATFQLNLTWKDADGNPINLTGYDARMQVRKRYTSTTPMLSFSVTGGEIVLGGAAGTIAITGAATVTDDITDKYGVWDLELISGGGIVYRLLEGSAEIRPEVTRP